MFAALTQNLKHKWKLQGIVQLLVNLNIIKVQPISLRLIHLHFLPCTSSKQINTKIIQMLTITAVQY